MRAIRSRTNSSGARTSLIGSLLGHAASRSCLSNLRTCLPKAYSTIISTGEAELRAFLGACRRQMSSRSARPGLFVPGPIERRHSPADREELALRVRLAGDAVAELVEERALEILGEQHAGVAERERRPLRELARQLPCPVEEPVLRKHLADGSPFERFLRVQLLPRE